jgi:putative ABC transport system ATP-binding protein
MSTPFVSLPGDAGGGGGGGGNALAAAEDVDVADVVIDAKNIHKTYLLGVEGVPALRGVSLKVARGEFIVILGKSG